MVGAHVPIDVEKAHGVSPGGDSALGHGVPEFSTAAIAGQLSELAAQRLDLRRPVEPEDSAEILR